MWSVNVRGSWLALKHALPLLTEGATVLVNTSVAGQKGPARRRRLLLHQGRPAHAGARAGPTELAARKIRVNAISPAPIETPIFGKVGLSRAQIDAFVKGCDQPRPAAADRGRGRDRGDGGLPRLGRRLVHHGQRDRGGWRLRAGLSAGRRRAPSAHPSTCSRRKQDAAFRLDARAPITAPRAAEFPGRGRDRAAPGPRGLSPSRALYAGLRGRASGQGGSRPRHQRRANRLLGEGHGIEVHVIAGPGDRRPSVR